MAHITALLIVLTLTGQPVANALCINWCDRPSAHQHCSDAIAPSTPAEFSTAGSTCVALPQAGPFLREEGRSAPPVATVVHAAQPLQTGLIDAGSLARAWHSGDPTAGRPLPTLVLRV